MRVNNYRGAELGKAAGYESGFWWGKITGAVVSISAFAATSLSLKVTAVTAPFVVGAIIVGGVGYIIGGAYGAKNSSEYCEAKGRELAMANRTEAEIIDICTSESVSSGIIGGATVGLAVGVLPVVILKYSPDLLGSGHKLDSSGLHHDHD